MKCMTALLLIVGTTLAIPHVASAGEGPKHRQLTAVPFTAVKITDGFWAPRIRTNREKSLPHNFKWCERTGRFANFAKAGGLIDGKFEGIYFNDSDVYKVLEGAAYSLADRPDPALEKMVDDVIAKIASAQQPNGYLNSYYTLVEPDKKWTNCRVRHELYCAGHMFEGAVAHYRATGKRTFLDVALRFADRIDELFGPGKRHDVPGHEEIELALVKLYQVTGEEKYLNLAKFFVDIRGDESKRPIYGDYCQDHKPVRQQSEIVGHAVRAMYLYAGVADVAAYTGDKGYIAAMDRLWGDVVRRKMYITGGIGARHSGESFGAAHELPNDSAYAETCAAIGLALWAHRLNLMHGDAQYADVLERVIYNGALSGIDLSGEKFFYVNPLASSGRHHRQPFFGCACCPSNVVRFVPSVPGYVYATRDDGLCVNLYVAGTGEMAVKNTKVALTQQTRYPWDGRVRLTVDLAEPAEFDLRLRVPGWCEGATIAVNGKPFDRVALEKGYAPIRRPWKSGDVVELDLPMPIRRIEAHPAVTADAGRVALQRGPVVYCFEAVDNDGRVSNIMLPHDPQLTAEHRDDLLGGVTVITATARDGRKITAVPYHAWDHRQPGEMIVWVRQDGKARDAGTDDPAWKDALYRPLDPTTLGPSIPLSIAETSTVTTSHCWAHDTPAALNNLAEPKSSNDHDIPRLTWWDHLGTTEWVQYEFESARKVSAMEVYWFDDERKPGKCRVPKSWRLLYKAGDGWKPVEGASAFGTALDKPNRVTFDAVETTALRIEVDLKPEFSGGVLQWKVE